MKKLKTKNNVLFILLIIVLLSIGNCKVNAYNLTTGDVTLECIYSDGSLVTQSQREECKKIAAEYGSDSAEFKAECDGNKYVINRRYYPLSGTKQINDNNTGVVTFSGGFTDNFTQLPGHNTTFRCHQYMHIGTLGLQMDDNGNVKEPGTTYIKFSESKDTKFDSSEVEPDFLFLGFWNWTNNADEVNKHLEHYQLVSENVIIPDGIEPNHILSFKAEAKKKDGEVVQASSSPEYIYILYFDNVILVKGREKTTYLEDIAGDPVTKELINMKFDENGQPIADIIRPITLSDASPKNSMDSDKNVSYYFNKYGVRYKNCRSDVLECYDRDGTTGTTIQYVYAGVVEDPNDILTGDFCDVVMPQTAKTLSKIIDVIQIFVPVLLIVLCGLDVAKVVISGNIDEDLPKQRKKIIIRFISAIVIFFLPLIVSLALEIVRDDSGGDIDITDVTIQDGDEKIENEIDSKEVISAIEYIECLFK